MMETAVATRQEASVLRPLKVLVSLIKEQLDGAKEASARAEQPYHEAVGDLLAEARPQFDTYAEFLSWTYRHFGFKETQSKEYLSVGRVREKKAAAPPRVASLRDFQRTHLGRDRPTNGAVRREWTAPVDDIAERARREAERIREAELTRQQERDAQRTLALRLIDIGYKVLAKELHPDKGGSHDAMTRLRAVVERLKAHA